MRDDISFKTTPLKSSTPKKGHVLVIGGGVTGLVTSWVLLDQGYQVTVMAKQWATYGKEQRITSQIAGALWEYPPAVCGQHTDAISLHHSRRWCMLAYRIWDAIAADPDLSRDSGVRMKNSAFFFPYKMEENEEQYQKMIDIKNSGVRGFQHSSSLIKHYGINPDYGCEDGYELVAPVIDTDTAMSWLMGLVGSKGAKFVTEAVEGDLFNHEHSLRERFGADIIVNATGLAGRELAGDTSCYPIRGGLMRVINDGSDFEKLDAALCISADAKHGTHTVNEIVFLVPRSDRILLLGGISEPHQWDLDHTLDSPIIKRMKDRCEAFLPRLKNARLDEEYPLAQGLRPFRECNVRVERELRRHRPGQGKNGISGYQNDTPDVIIEGTDDDADTVSRIIHSYGQGGAGWSLSFGCAGDVLALVGEAMAGKPPKPMSLE